jgi:hypothetical protein
MALLKFHQRRRPRPRPQPQQKTKLALQKRKRKQEDEGLLETVFLLSSPQNAKRLHSALAQAKAGKLVEHGLDDE